MQQNNTQTHNGRGKDWLVFSALIGMTSLAFQSATIKILFTFFAESTIVASIAISTYLAGLALGHLVAMKMQTKKEALANKTLQTVWWTQLAMAFYAVALLQNTDVAWAILGLKSTWPFIGYVVICLYLLPIGLLTGMCFPLLTGCYLHDNRSHKGLHTFHKPTAIILAWDTIGSITGCLISGVWLIPMFGLATTLQVTAGVAVLTASGAKIKYNKRLFQGWVLVFVGLSLMVWPVFQWNRPEVNPGKPEYFITPHKGKRELFFEKESPYGTIRVTTGFESDRSKMLWINMRSMVETEYSYSERQLAMLAMRQVEENFPSGEIRVLNIGLGGGLTASETLNSPRVKLTISEINPVIVEAAKKHFKKENNHLLEKENSHRVKLNVENGFDTLRNSKDHYWHVIIIDIEEPTIIYSSGLYTKEAFELMEKKLVPGGVVGVWAQSIFDGYAKVISNTMEAAFRNAALRILPGKSAGEHFSRGEIYDYDKQCKDRPQDGSIGQDVDCPDCFHYVLFGSQGSLRKIENPLYCSEASHIGRIKQLRIHEVNTIKKPVLEKYFKTNSWFGLPPGYTEEFYMK